MRRNPPQPLPGGEIFDDRVCGLGESPLWHPERETLFWVDIPNQVLMSRRGSTVRNYEFDEMISAIGWIDVDRLLIAAESGLSSFDLISGERALLCGVEADRSTHRSNDARADPWGGFWVGTMHKEADHARGAIYRWYGRRLRRVADRLTVPNGICFDRDRARAYYADSHQQIMYVLAVNAETGWPEASPKVFCDLSGQDRVVDGAVVDQEGCVWAAMYGAGEITRFGPDAAVMSRIETQTPRPTCPAFGGSDARDLYVTTASLGLEAEPSPDRRHGTTLVFPESVRGRHEPPVVVSG